MKRLALAHLLARGCRAAALEVRCPIARYRLDAAGFLDRAPLPPDVADPILWTSGSRPKRPPTQTFIIECKQARSDFLRDRRNSPKLLARRRILERRRIDLEEGFLKRAEPHLRMSQTSLFPECEAWDFAESRSPAYRKLICEIEQVERDLYGGTKFCTMTQYRLADHLYLIAPAGLVKVTELPPGWGLIECSKSVMRRTEEPITALQDCSLRIRRDAPVLTAAKKFRARLLRNIAVAATLAALRAQTPADSSGDKAPQEESAS